MKDYWCSYTFAFLKMWFNIFTEKNQSICGQKVQIALRGIQCWIQQARMDHEVNITTCGQNTWWLKGARDARVLFGYATGGRDPHDSQLVRRESNPHRIWIWDKFVRHLSGAGLASQTLSQCRTNPGRFILEDPRGGAKGLAAIWKDVPSQ